MTPPQSLRFVEDHQGVFRRIVSYLDLFVWLVILIGVLLVINVFQCLSLLFLPFSGWLVWKINREFGQLWWSLLVFWMEKWLRVRVEISGDEIPHGENALLISNHQQMPDIPILMTIAIRRGRLGDMKWFVKDSLKYVPGIGWGMYFLGCVFLKRNWYADHQNIQKTFGRLKGLGVPFWLVSFVEGTRITPRKLAKAQDFAKVRGYAIPQHTLIPKRKGFINAIQGLGDRIDAVYDATIFYDQGIPSLSQFARGLTKSAKLHIRRFPMKDLPTTEDGLSEWLQARYVEKDKRLRDLLVAQERQSNVSTQS